MEVQMHLGQGYWCAVGPVNGKKKNSSVSCNKITVEQVDLNQVREHLFQSIKEVKKRL